MKLEELKEAEEGDLGDFIITKFELGKLTRDEAWKELVKNKIGNFFWEMELNAAEDLKNDAPNKKDMH